MALKFLTLSYLLKLSLYYERRALDRYSVKKIMPFLLFLSHLLAFARIRPRRGNNNQSVDESLMQCWLPAPNTTKNTLLVGSNYFLEILNFRKQNWGNCLETQIFFHTHSSVHTYPDLETARTKLFHTA